MRLLRFIRKKPFSSSRYWEQRYKSGGNSGAGSYNLLSEFKAGFINDFVEANGISTVIEFGCGDGNQLGLFQIPQYHGVDVSSSAIRSCQAAFSEDATRTFSEYNPDSYDSKADLSLSLDVLYHLVEDAVYQQYLKDLFSASSKWVIIYSCNHSSTTHPPHVLPRHFTLDVERDFSHWELAEHLPNPYPLEKFGPRRGSWSDFYVYRKRDSS